MKSDLKISLIVPTYNRTENTRLFLECIVKYHQEDLHEVIFSDDGSSEDQESVLKEFRDVLKISCRLVTQEDQGFRLARVRNNGVRYASGDYLCFLDQDLIPSPHFFRETKRFARPEKFLIYRTLWTTQEQKMRILSNFKEDYLLEIRNNDEGYLWRTVVKDYFYYLGKLIGIGDRRPKLKGGAFSLFKSDFESVNGFDETFVGWGREDDDLGRRLYLKRILGLNISHRAWNYHLWHEETPTKSVSPNVERFNNKLYDKNTIRPEFGLSVIPGEEVKVLEIN